MEHPRPTHTTQIDGCSANTNITPVFLLAVPSLLLLQTFEQAPLNAVEPGRPPHTCTRPSPALQYVATLACTRPSSALQYVAKNTMLSSKSTLTLRARGNDRPELD